MRNLSVLIVITMLVALPFISFDSSAESVVLQPNENSGLYSFTFLTLLFRMMEALLQFGQRIITMFEL